MSMHTPPDDRVGTPEPTAKPVSAPLPLHAAPDAAQISSRARRSWGLGLGALALLLLCAGIVPRIVARQAQAAQVEAQRELSVSTITPTPAPATQELLLPGAVMPWADVAIYARTSGYVKQWFADIGAHVKATQVLARLDTPELDAQLRQARADEATALANYRFASSTAQRWQTMLQTQSVSPQDADAKTSDAAAKLAALQAAQANVSRLAELVAYQSVTAPFDGVVSARNVQVGALVTAGGAPGLPSMSGELFHIEQTDRLRVYVDVPQDDANRMTPDTQAWIATEQFPGRRFTGTIARDANAIDPVSRTLRVEIDVDNRDGALLPGAYTQVHLTLKSDTPGLELPVSALLFRPDGVSIATVDAHDKVALRRVSIGRDFGTYVEIATGLSQSDRVIANPGDAISDGQRVRSSIAPTYAANNAGESREAGMTGKNVNPGPAAPVTSTPAATAGKL
ncbi:RND family efflux transporter MFP subunit [Pandoraea communis]|uniref:RND family efflux transporter MFP subunit n=1 Tax=Pandoraea communis TaxID=2508297 RepID=A0A5E4RUI9_9BURK|nr:efflux RND transporter periplasmic adaptor subunit [Pandoraea communis]VVD67136.1 RND family efflux transporter MFP subunit [Pandoraea communis]